MTHRDAAGGRAALVAALTILCAAGRAQHLLAEDAAPSTPSASVTGFVDTYYAYKFNKTADLYRNFDGAQLLQLEPGSREEDDQHSARWLQNRPRLRAGSKATDMSPAVNEGSKLNHLGLVALPPARPCAPWPSRRADTRGVRSQTFRMRARQTEAGCVASHTEDAPGGTAGSAAYCAATV